MDINDDLLKIISNNLDELMQNQTEEYSAKDLAERSGISYSTLAPILRGERDFRVTNLVALAEALNTTPDELLRSTFRLPEVKQLTSDRTKQPRILATFLTGMNITHCRFYDVETGKYENRIAPYKIFCGKQSLEIINQLKETIEEVYGSAQNWSDVHIYVSALATEHVENMLRLRKLCAKEFGKFIIENDWRPVYGAHVAKKNGILVTVNDGYAVVYTDDEGKTLNKLQGYYYPLSDYAGNHYIGCEALKHAINVKEGLEPRSLLSDKILGHVNSDLELLAVKVYENPYEYYLMASNFVKEFSHKKGKSYEILKQSFENIWKRIELIDKKTQKKLPIFLSGDLAYLYENFFPTDRLISLDIEDSLNMQFAYSFKQLKQSH